MSVRTRDQIENEIQALNKLLGSQEISQHRDWQAVADGDRTMLAQYLETTNPKALKSIWERTRESAGPAEHMAVKWLFEQSAERPSSIIAKNIGLEGSA